MKPIIVNTSRLTVHVRAKLAGKLILDQDMKPFTSITLKRDIETNNLEVRGRAVIVLDANDFKKWTE